MFGNSRKMVLSENKGGQPRYSLSYRRGGLGRTSKKLSYDIISRLVKERELLIEIDSSLFIGSYSDTKEKVFAELVPKLDDLNIGYKYLKSSSPQERKIFGLSVSGSQTDTRHVLLIYVPNRTWVQEGFWGILPDQGATYHVLKQGTNGTELLEAIYAGRLLDEEIRKHYETTIFDYYSFGQMGIDTGLSKGELEGCLKDLMGLDC